ncbi:L-PSP endoribonuclease family protein [Xylogone sp. PMI_703]|nr:L-PSP endoribonuclease family protein [Xylogone sp. PMI_703]
MSHLAYYNYEGVGQRNAEQSWYSQVVRVGDRIECAGQGGWNPETGEVYKEINAQIDQAFATVGLNLKNASGKGREQVYRINSYHMPLTNEVMDATVRNFKKYMPNHRPIWTCVGVTQLGEDGMNVEIEVVAYDPQDI